MVKRILKSTLHALCTHFALLRCNAMREIKSGVSVAALAIEMGADAVDTGNTI